MAARTADFQAAIQSSKMALDGILDGLRVHGDVLESGIYKRVITIELSGRIPDLIAGNVRTTFQKLFADAEAAFTAAWKAHITERIVLYHLGRALGDRFLENREELADLLREEVIVPPVPTVIANDHLETALTLFRERAAGPEFSTQVVNYRDVRTLFDAGSSMPSRMTGKIEAFDDRFEELVSSLNTHGEQLGAGFDAVREDVGERFAAVEESVRDFLDDVLADMLPELLTPSTSILAPTKARVSSSSDLLSSEDRRKLAEIARPERSCCRYNPRNPCHEISRIRERRQPAQASCQS